MRTRRDGTAEVLLVDDDDDDDWVAKWQCTTCGYTNLGRDRCIRCGGRAPADAEIIGRRPDEPTATLDGIPAAASARDARRAPLTPVRSSNAGRGAGRTVAAIIGVNLVVQVLLLGIISANHMELASAVRLSLFVGLLFYAASALWVLARSASLGLRPEVGRDGALVGAAEGFVVGGAMALLLAGLLRLVLGHAVVDPTAAVLAADGALGPLVFGFLIIAVAAPIVEELVFRGFLAEAFRGRGRRSAVLVSAVAFSLAHLRLGQFRYYLLLGVVLGLVYWRRGLVGSVSAHAAFNAMLLMVAVAATHGPSLEVSAAGARITLPPAWVTTAKVAGDDLVATGPTGTRVELAHADVPGALPPAEVLAERVRAGGVPLPSNIELDYTTVAVVDLPAGHAVSVKATVGGHDGRLAMVPKGHRLWLASGVGGGGAAAGDVDAILRSWVLP